MGRLGLSVHRERWETSDAYLPGTTATLISSEVFEAPAAAQPFLVVQSKTQAYNNYTQSRTITPTSAVAAGNSLLLFVGTSAATADNVTSVTDSLGNTWLKDHSSRNGGRTGDFWRVQSSAAGTPVITINTTDFVTTGMNLYEVKGLLASPFDTATSVGNSATNNPSTTVTNTVQPAVVIAAYVGDQPAGTYTASGFSSLITANGGDFLSTSMAYKGVTTTTAQTAGFTISTPSTGNLVALAYKVQAVTSPEPDETEPTTDSQRLLSVYKGWKNRYQRTDGAIVRPLAEGNGDTTNGYAPAPDVVSEGIAYKLIYAVQFNEPAQFDLTEAWAYANLDRRNYVNPAVGSNPPSDGFNLMAYHYNPTNNTVYDWAAAYDADIDRARALLWAHSRWGSAGTINYLARALAILADLVSFGLRQASFDSQWYMVSGSGNMATATPEMNNSYLDPAAFRLFAQYDATNAAKWNSAVSSSYDIIQRTADAVLPNPAAPGNTQTTTAKLPANWVTMNFTTGAVSPLAATFRDTNYTYDAFRQANRLLFDWRTNAEPRAKARLQDYKAFLASYWTTNGRIEAEYFHDGTVKAAYEARMFYYAAWQALTIDDPSNATAAAIWSGKLTGLYKYVSNNSYYDNSPTNTGDFNYYNQSWLLFDEMERQGSYINYGQVLPGSTVTKTQPATARIAKLLAPTQPATARLQKTLTATRTATARLQTNRTLTQGATSRLAASRTAIEPATARLATSRTSTQPATSRLATSRTLTQPATAAVVTTAAGTKTQPATSRLTVTATRTQTATARLQLTKTRTQTATARVRVTKTATRTATARLTLTRTATRGATARLSRTQTATQSATSFVVNQSSYLAAQNATARLAKTVTRTQPATATLTRLAQTLTRTQTSTARVSTSRTATQPTTARVRVTRTLTQTGRAFIVYRLTKTQPATARLATLYTETNTATARLQASQSHTQTAAARIRLLDATVTPAAAIQGTTWAPNGTTAATWTPQALDGAATYTPRGEEPTVWIVGQ